jgi:hypothetical protein
LAQNSLLASHKHRHLQVFNYYLYLLHLNQKTPEIIDRTSQPVIPPQVNQLLLRQLARQKTPKPESDKDFEARRRLFLEYKNNVYKKYTRSLNALDRQLNNTEKYRLFVNKFFEDVDGLSALLPNHYNLNRATSQKFLNHFIETFSKNEAQILHSRPEPHAEVIESFVGSGKTFLIGMMLAALPDGLKAFISTFSKDLQRQLLNTIVRFTPDKNISQISSNNYKAEPVLIRFDDGTIEEYQIPYGLGGDIVFGVNNTVARLQEGQINQEIISEEDIEAFDPILIIFDEVHTITSNSERNKSIKSFIRKLIDKGGSFIGFSATPHNLTTQPRSDDDCTVQDGRRTLFTHPNQLASNFLLSVGIPVQTIFKRSIEDGIEAGELPQLRWYTTIDRKFDTTTSPGRLPQEQVSPTTNENWDIICDSIAQQIKNHPELKELRGFSFTPNIKASQTLAKTLTENGIPAASYSSSGIFISTEIFNTVQNRDKDNNLNKILVNKKFKGQTQEVQEHPGYTLISNYSHRNHNKDILFTLLKNRKLLNISSVGMLGTGIDLPWLELAVMPMPTNSHTLYIQRIGRITRLDPGNPRKIAYVLAHPSIPQIQ